MSKKENDLGRRIALDVLSAPDGAAMLEETIRYCFDQLCYRASYRELDELLAELRAMVSEDAQ